MANSLAHSKWVCKYHIVFTPKYRRKIDYWGMREDIRDIIRDLCKWKGVAIIEGKVMPDHIHLLLSIPPKYSVSFSIWGEIRSLCFIPPAEFEGMPAKMPGRRIFSAPVFRDPDSLVQLTKSREHHRRLHSGSGILGGRGGEGHAPDGSLSHGPVHGLDHIVGDAVQIGMPGGQITSAASSASPGACTAFPGTPCIGAT